jgi:hypothetical protein
MSNIFSKVVHWAGVVITHVLHGFQTAEKRLDVVAPNIEDALTKGASVAQFIPGIGPEVAAGLNLGAELTGALDRVLHDSDEEFQKIVATVKQSLPPNSSFSVLLIPKEVETDAKQFFAQIEAELAAAKDKAAAVTGGHYTATLISAGDGTRATETVQSPHHANSETDTKETTSAASADTQRETSEVGSTPSSHTI